MALEKDRICATGLAILEAEGFEALSLRKIADALGVQTPALYWYVKDRAELYGLMAEAMLREVLADIGHDLSGRDWLIAFGRALRASHLRRRDSAKLAAFVKPSPLMRTELLEHIVARVMAGGVERQRAFLAQSAVQSFTLGWSLFQGNEDVSNLMSQVVDPAAGFEESLVALADGLTSS